ncbi:MAG: hypothetical protein Q9164_006276 [Protoblastenia rupestris]
MTSVPSRTYDLIVFGATGYTGKLTAEHITTHLPTDLKWAVAGRSETKLSGIVNELKTLNADRTQPDNPQTMPVRHKGGHRLPAGNE